MTYVQAPGRHRRRTSRSLAATMAVLLLVMVAPLAAVDWVGTARADQPAGPDPTAPGPHRVSAVAYDLGDTAFPLEGFQIELAGTVYYPADLGDGGRPMVLMAHGLFATCADREAAADRAEARGRLFGPDPIQDPAERERLEKMVAEEADRKQALEDVFWSLLNSREFMFNH